MKKKKLISVICISFAALTIVTLGGLKIFADEQKNLSPDEQLKIINAKEERLREQLDSMDPTDPGYHDIERQMRENGDDFIEQKVKKNNEDPLAIYTREKMQSSLEHFINYPDERIYYVKHTNDLPEEEKQREIADYNARIAEAQKYLDELNATSDENIRTFAAKYKAKYGLPLDIIAG